MDTLFFMLLFASTMVFVFRWMLTWGTTVINRQTVRQFLLQRLAAAYPGMLILDEKEHTFSLQIGQQVCILHFDQLYRRCTEAPTQTSSYIRQVIKSLEDALHETDAIPEHWEQLVIPLLLRLDGQAPPDFLTRPFVDSLAIGYALNMGSVFRWLTSQAVAEAGIDVEHLHTIAMRNLDRSCNALVIESPRLDADGRERFLRFLTGDGLDAARVLLPSFYTRFSSRFDDSDLLVSIPSRDSLAMVSTQDKALANMLAWRSAHDRAQQAYPLYPRLLHISEHGLIPWAPGESAQV